MKLTAESLYYSTHLHSTCFIRFPRGLSRPDIKGLGYCERQQDISMDGVLFIQERSTDMQLSNTALLYVTHSDTAFSMPESREDLEMCNKSVAQ